MKYKIRCRVYNQFLREYSYCADFAAKYKTYYAALQDVNEIKKSMHDTLLRETTGVTFDLWIVPSTNKACLTH